MKVRPIGIRARLTVTYALVFVALLGAFGVVSYRVLKNGLDDALSDELVNRAAALRGYLRFTKDNATLSFNHDDPEEAYFIQISTRYYQIYEIGTGRLMAQSPELEILGLDLNPEEVESQVQGGPFSDVHTDHGDLRFRNEVIEQDGRTFLFQIGASMVPMQDALRRYFELMLWLIPLNLVIASIVGWWAAGRALLPVTRLAATARDIEVSDLTRRLPVTGSHDELDKLAQTFNETFSRLAHAIDEMRQFTASISHELRTPLAILRGEAEIALMQPTSNPEFRRVLSSQLEEFEKLTRMINQLLTLARAEAGEIPMGRGPVDLCPLVKSLADQITPIAEARQLHLTVQCEHESIVAAGDSGWLERVILNLLDNAMKFSRSGGMVKISVQTTDKTASIEVSDSGPGISPESLPHIFERFYQADAARSGQQGAGLGLSLVKWIVQRHGGSIDVRSNPGVGSTFRVLLPLY
jgi:heavy metal sensor kinase